jgi:hypothetical protein
MWPQCWDLQGPRGLEQGDLRNLNLGDLKQEPNGGVSPPPKRPCYSWPRAEDVQGFQTPTLGRGQNYDPAVFHPIIHWIRRRVYLRTVLDNAEKKDILWRESKSGH